MKKLLSLIDRMIERIVKWNLLFSGVLILMMSVASTYGVARRYLFHRPEPYSYEISTILLVACVVLALSGLQHQDRHLRVDFIASRFPRTLQKIINHIITPLLGLFYVGIIVVKSWENAWYAMRIGESSQSVWEEPLYPTKMIVTLGMALLCIVLIVQLVRGLSNLLNRKSAC